METWLIPLLTLLVGGAVSAFGTYFATRGKLRSDYDSDLRRKRIDGYLQLWCHLKILARYGSPADFDRSDMVILGKQLQSWYFEGGGLYLSTRSRNAFFILQDVLSQAQTEREPVLTEEQIKEQIESLRMYGSRLRTSLTYDVGTRSRPRMPGEIDRSAYLGTRTYIHELQGKEYRLTLDFGGRVPRHKPQVTISGPGLSMGKRVRVQDWLPQQSTIVVRVPAVVVPGNTAKGTPAGNGRASWVDRELLVEKGVVVMGPALRDRYSHSVTLWQLAGETAT